MKIEITNGKLFQIDDNNTALWKEIKSLRISNGIVSSIDSTTHDFKPDTVIDAQGCYILPGLIDLNVSLREPGFTSKGTIESETRAAAAGGVTTLCCTPETSPCNDSKAVTNLIEEQTNKFRNCRVFPLGALTKGLLGEQLSEYASLKEAGCVGLSNAYHPIKNLSVTKRCFEYAKTHELSVFINPIEPSLHDGVMHENHVSTTVGLQGIPSLAETIAVSQLIQLAEATGVHLHLSQLSAAQSVDLIENAKKKGIDITADVAIHNLMYVDQNVEHFDSMYHCLPPFRTEHDRLALVKGVNSGVIDAVTSAHQPHEAAAKQMPFAETAPGMTGIEFLLPMAMKLHSGKKKGGSVNILKFIQSMTSGSSKVLKSPLPGIDVNQPADICVFDPCSEYTLEYEDIISQGKNTPLVGQKMTGKVMATILKGNISYIRQ